MKKQLLLGAMILCLAGSMTACSGTSKAAQDNKAQEKETYTLKVSHVQGDNAPVVQALYQFEKDVEADSNGRLQIEVFPNGIYDGCRPVCRYYTGYQRDLRSLPV